MIYEYMTNIGFTNQEISTILCSYSVAHFKNDTLYENIRKLFDFLLSIGYSQSNIVKMVKLHPGICCYSVDMISEKIKFLISLGYNKKEVIKMTVVSSSIFGLSIENIKSKMDNLLELGYTKEEIIKQIKCFPQIFNLSIENIRNVHLF